MNAPKADFEVAVVGGGPVGLATAIGLAQNGIATALVARKISYRDNRTSALLGDSIGFLQSLDVWRRCEHEAAALKIMRLIDDTGRLVRAPEVRFAAKEIGQDTFGYNLENNRLIDALEQRAAELSNLVRCDDEAIAIEPAASNVSIKTDQGQHLTAAVLGGADGRASLARRSAGIDVRTKTFNQSALTFNVTHSRPHNNISTEFHTPYGPCVFVPLPGMRSSIVWVTIPDQASRMQALADDELGALAEQQSHSILGAMHPEGNRHLFPLAIQTPLALAAKRIALLGEAAHVFPPIGAQGLNLGLRDAADFIRIVSEAHAGHDDLGAEKTLSRYSLARRGDVTTRTMAIEFANRSLLSDFLPIHSLRATGLHILNAFSPIRRFAMREGLSPWWRRTG
jgi:2-octaprenyl-6-methoxyphenol hydroxylase